MGSLTVTPLSKFQPHVVLPLLLVRGKQRWFLILQLLFLSLLLFCQGKGCFSFHIFRDENNLLI